MDTDSYWKCITAWHFPATEAMGVCEFAWAVLRATPAIVLTSALFAICPHQSAYLINRMRLIFWIPRCGYRDGPSWPARHTSLYPTNVAIKRRPPPCPTWVGVNGQGNGVASCKFEHQQLLLLLLKTFPLASGHPWTRVILATKKYDAR